ncbi:hypothetical protein Z947_2645 [Sulfitobacter geojensis]|nr:hypothetical protein Z947_2645 [Sulfitobacter geojensis]
MGQYVDIVADRRSAAHFRKNESKYSRSTVFHLISGNPLVDPHCGQLPRAAQCDTNGAGPARKPFPPYAAKLTIGARRRLVC